METVQLPPQGTPGVIDLTALVELREIMGEDFDVLLDTFFNDSEKKLVDIRAALQQNDFESVRLLAHSLKGSSSNLYAGQLKQFCYELEHAAPGKDAVLLHSLLENIEEEYQLVKGSLLSAR